MRAFPPEPAVCYAAHPRGRRALVGAALPDPPFEFAEAAAPAGFDIDWMQAIAPRLGLGGASSASPATTSTASSTASPTAATTASPPAPRSRRSAPGRRLLRPLPHLRPGARRATSPRTPDVRSTDDLRGLVLARAAGQHLRAGRRAPARRRPRRRRPPLPLRRDRRHARRPRGRPDRRGDEARAGPRLAHPRPAGAEGSCSTA